MSKSKRGPGRPKANIDAAQVDELTQMGATVEEMAVALGVNKKTLNRRFKKAIEEGRLKRNVALRTMQWSAAKSGSIAMQIWLGKQLLGQSDKTQLTGKDDGPIQHDVRTLTDEQIDKEIENLIGPIARGSEPTGSSDSGTPEEA